MWRLTSPIRFSGFSVATLNEVLPGVAVLRLGEQEISPDGSGLRRGTLFRYFTSRSEPGFICGSHL